MPAALNERRLSRPLGCVAVCVGVFRACAQMEKMLEEMKAKEAAPPEPQFRNSKAGGFSDRPLGQLNKGGFSDRPAPGLPGLPPPGMPGGGMTGLPPQRGSHDDGG